MLVDVGDDMILKKLRQLLILSKGIESGALFNVPIAPRNRTVHYVKIYPVIRDIVPHVIVDANEELLITVHPLVVIFYAFAFVKCAILIFELGPKSVIFRVGIHVEALFDSGKNGMLVVVRVIRNHLTVIFARHRARRQKRRNCPALQMQSAAGDDYSRQLY